jgi:hypothetical protein
MCQAIDYVMGNEEEIDETTEETKENIYFEK